MLITVVNNELRSWENLGKNLYDHDLPISKLLASSSSQFLPIYLPHIHTRVIGELASFFSMESRSSYLPKFHVHLHSTALKVLWEYFMYFLEAVRNTLPTYFLPPLSPSYGLVCIMRQDHSPLLPINKNNWLVKTVFTTIKI